jgi:hypothetical protein
LIVKRCWPRARSAGVTSTGMPVPHWSPILPVIRRLRETHLWRRGNGLALDRDAHFQIGRLGRNLETHRHGAIHREATAGVVGKKAGGRLRFQLGLPDHVRKQLDRTPWAVPPARTGDDDHQEDNDEEYEKEVLHAITRRKPA